MNYTVVSSNLCSLQAFSLSIKILFAERVSSLEEEAFSEATGILSPT